MSCKVRRDGCVGVIRSQSCSKGSPVGSHYSSWCEQALTAALLTVFTEAAHDTYLLAAEVLAALAGRGLCSSICGACDQQLARRLASPMTRIATLETKVTLSTG